MTKQIRPCRQEPGFGPPASPLCPLSLLVGGVTVTLSVPLGVALGVYAGTIAVASLVRWLGKSPANNGPDLELLGATWVNDLDLLDAEEVTANTYLHGTMVLVAKPTPRGSVLDRLHAEARA